MKKRLISIAFIFLIVIYVYSPPRGYALNCVNHYTPDQFYDLYDAVIIGTVENIDRSDTVKTLSVNVEKSLKGVTDNTIIVTEDNMWGISQANETYLYFLMKAEDTWTSPLCAPTTSDLSLVEQYLADKEELPLVGSNVNKLLNEQEEQSSTLHIATVIAAILTLLFIVVTVLIVLKRKVNRD